MRAPLLIALLLSLLILVGCDSTKELNDESFAEFYAEYWEAEREEIESAMEKYGWTDDELNTYMEALSKDEARTAKVLELIKPLDENAVAGLQWELSLYGAADELERLNRELEDALRALGL